LEVVENLISKHRWEIQFEDWGEVKDETLKEIFGRSGQRWLVRQPSTISLEVPSPDTMPKNLRGQVMAQILDSHRSSGPPILFGSSFDGATVQVFPVAVRQTDGTLTQVMPLFDTRVTVPLGKYSIGEIVNRIVGQIEERRSVSIVLGTVPRSLFDQDAVTVEAIDKPARDVLLTAFRDINQPRLQREDDYVVPVWSLRYEPTGKRFYLNVGFAERVPFSEMMTTKTQQPEQNVIRRTKPKPGTRVLDPNTRIEQ